MSSQTYIHFKNNTEKFVLNKVWEDIPADTSYVLHIGEYARVFLTLEQLARLGQLCEEVVTSSTIITRAER